MLGIALGIAMAVPMSAWAIARRTDRVFPAFVDHGFEGLDGAVGQLLLCPEGVTEAEAEATQAAVCLNRDVAPDTERLAARDDVVAATHLSFVFGTVSVVATGFSDRQGVELFYNDPIVLDGEVVSVGNGEGRGRMIDGTLPDFRAAEVIVNDAFLDHFGVRVGDTISVAMYSQQEYSESLDGSTPPARPPVPVRISGTARWASDLRTSSGDDNIYARGAKMVAGRGLLDAFAGDVATFGVLVAFVPAPGIDPESVLADEFGDRLFDVQRVRDLSREPIESIRRSTHLQANGVRVFAAVTGIAAAVFGGQILVRQSRREIGSRDTLVALGLRDAEIRTIALIRMSIIGLAMIVTAIVATYLSSAIGAIGIARRADFGATLDFDWLAVLAGVVGIALVVAAAALLGARRLAAKPASLFEPFAKLLGLSSTISPAARLGTASLWPVGSTRVQAARRTSSASCFAAAAVAVAAAILVGSLNSLVAAPRGYGFPWDVQVGSFGENPEGAPAALASIEDVPGITAGSLLYASEFSDVDGNTQVLLAVGPLDGYDDVAPPITEGHAPLGPNEIALGRPFADQLDKHIGDTVVVTISRDSGDETIEMTIVGYAVISSLFPLVDPQDGVLVHASVLEGQGPQAIMLRLTGSDREAGIAQLRAAFPSTFATPQPPTSVRNLESTASVPTLLSIVIGLLAAASIVHALAILARGSQRDMAMLRVFGATASHARSAMFWLASALTVPALVLGAIVGAVAGRIGWQRITRDRALDQSPGFMPLAIVAVVVGGSLIASCVAWWPARRATKEAPGTILRAE